MTLFDFLNDPENDPAVLKMLDHAVRFGAGPSSDVGSFAQALTAGNAPTPMHTLLRASHAAWLDSDLSAITVIELAEDAPVPPVAPAFDIDMTSGKVNADGYAEFQGKDDRTWTDVRKENEHEADPNNNNNTDN